MRICGKSKERAAQCSVEACPTTGARPIGRNLGRPPLSQLDTADRQDPSETLTLKKVRRHLQVRNSVRPEPRTQVVTTASTPDCRLIERLQRTANREETRFTKEFRVLQLLSYPRSADPNRGKTEMPVFYDYDAHERVLFINNEKACLRAISAVHNTNRGPS